MGVDSWMVPDENIINGNPMASFNHLNYDYQVIFQLSDNEIVTKNAARLASKHPDKTLIIYYDINEDKSRVVHGSPDKLQGSRVRWILAGHGDNKKHTFDGLNAESLYAAVDSLKICRNMVSPERIILYSCNLGIDPYEGIKDHFALEFAEIMQKNKDKASLRAYSKKVGTAREEYVKVKNFGRRTTEADDQKGYYFKNIKHRVDYRIDSDGQLFINNTPMATYILQDIAEGRISAVEAAKKYKKHFLYDINADSDGKIDPNRLSQWANNLDGLLQFIPNTPRNNTGERVIIWTDTNNSSPPLSLNGKKANAVTLSDNDDISEHPNKFNKLSETSQHEVSSLKDNMTSSEFSLSCNNRLSKIANSLGRGNQMIALTRLAISTSVLVEKLNSSETTQQEKEDIKKTLALSWSEFAVDFGIDVMQPSFEKGAKFFARKVPLTKGISQVGARAGSLIAKSAGPVLNIASAGFDIYNVVQIYGQLERETDPDKAKDLIINGTFSALGAGVGILTAAALAVGFAVAGPLGILAGIGISLAAMIYNAVSTIAKIKEQIDLTPWEEFKNGTRLAFGADLEESVAARLDEKQKYLLRESIDKYAKEIADNRLVHSGVSEYYYAYGKYGEVKKTQYYYINKKKKDYLVNVLNSNDDNFFKFESEFIHKDTRQILSEDIYKKNWMKCSYREYEEYSNNSDYVVEIRQDDVFDINGETPIAIIIDNEYFNDKYSDDYVEHTNIRILDKVKTEHTGHLSISSSANKKVHFNTGVGNSYVFADRHTQNSFDITQGKKTFVGGDLDDMFYLHGNELHEIFEPSQLDGRKGEDTIAVLGVDKHNVIGYKIDLMTGTVNYHYKYTPNEKVNGARVLMNIANIEHIHSAEDTDDILTGNDQVNVLNGMGGRDILKGHGGNDMLSLQSGEAYGGSGSDNYKILQNKKNKSVSVALFEPSGNEISHVILDYSLQKIENVYLSGNDVCIVLKNENSTLTTLMLKDVYSDINHGDKKRNNDFIFYTKDGFILTPQWQEILVNEGGHGDGEFNPTLAAYQFSNKSSFLSDVNSPIPSAFISKKNGVNIIKVDNINIVLKDFIDPILLGHDFSSDILEGSAQDDLFYHLGAGDDIYVSHGNDKYIIDTMALPDTTQHDTLTLSNNGNHDWTTGQEQTFFLNDISGDELQITSKIFNGEQEVIISHKQLPDDYLKIKFPMPEEGNLVENKFYVVDKDEKRFIVKYNFLEADISPEFPPEIPDRRHFTLSKGNYLTWKLDASVNDDFDAVVDDGLAVSADDADDMGRLINDMGNMPVQKPQHTFLSNFYSHFNTSNYNQFNTSDLPPVVAAQ
ncbi:C80 family cysteine peptidase [Yersinia mollaretii]|uniref:C80 family cysteine peptidase n=1 Tax=Yersinia mollaretii TaxID=33060 RepID=UPI0021BD498F|nr:C80 family cysteine peptidase [Yersinia mollaretii]